MSETEQNDVFATASPRRTEEDLTVGLSVKGRGEYAETDGIVTDTRNSHSFDGAVL